MNTILKLRSARVETRPEYRVLAIEPDAAQGNALRHVFEAHVRSDFQIVQSVNEALASIAQHVPDLILTSTFFPPRDEAVLMNRLKDFQAAAHVQIVTTPYFIDYDDEPEQRRIRKFLKRRRSLIRPSDAETVGRQIETYLEQARATRELQNGRARRVTPRRPTVLPMRRKGEPSIVRPAIVSVQAAPGAECPTKDARVQEKDRRRGRRKPGGDVPWLWSVSAPTVGNVKVVDISSHGVLVETTSKLPIGRAIDLHLIGENIETCVAARITRSEIGSVDALGVRYRMAATFSRELDIPGVEARVAAEAVHPGALAELLARALQEVDAESTPSKARRTFEHGLRRLLSAVDVQIRQSPVISAQGSESVYFTIPSRGTHAAILQATFESDRPPTPGEFKLLKAAATLAAVVLEFAPVDQSG
jgi:CheY-like chemotaxis protein